LSEAEELARAFLRKAWDDLKAARILDREGLKDLAIYHLEQASEKILKAFFIGFLIDCLGFLTQICDVARRTGIIPANLLSKYRKLHNLISSIVKQYRHPRMFGHDFTEFLDEWLRKLYQELCYGDFGGYLELVLLKGFIPLLNKRKQRILDELVSEGLSAEQAENVLNFVISSLTEFFKHHVTFIKSLDFRVKICSGKSGELGSVKEVLEKIEESREPCIHAGVELCRIVDEKFRSILGETLEKNHEVVEAFEKAEKTLREIATQIGPSTLEQGDLKTFMINLLRGIMLLAPLLTLHFCLYKYHKSSRYPEGAIPVEEYKAIPETIELLEKVHELVEHLI